MPEYHANMVVEQHEDDDLDYPFDFTSWLPSGDTISSHVVSVESGLTLGTNSHTTTEVAFWISGGTAGTDYACEVKVTTANSRVYNLTFSFSIVDVRTV